MKKIRKKITESLQYFDKDSLLTLASIPVSILCYPLKCIRRISYDPCKVKNILILAYNQGMGSALLLTPALQTLKEFLPQASLTLLASDENVKQVLSLCPAVDEIILEKKVPELRLFSGVKFFREYFKERNFDLCISTLYERSSKNSFWAAATGIPYRIGRRTGPVHFLDTWIEKGVLNRHEVIQNLEIIKYVLKRDIDIAQLDKNIDFVVPEEERERAARILEEQGLSGRGPILAVHTGAKAAWHQKIWPLDRFVETADAFRERFGGEIALFAGNEESPELLEKVSCSRSYRFIKRMKPATVGALLEKCDLALTNDSGFMHLAAAVNLPVTAVFGPTRPEKNHPWGAHFKIVASDFACSPCYTFDGISCGSGECMKGIDTVKVLQAMTEIYESVSCVREAA